MSYSKTTIVGHIGNDFQQSEVNGRFVANGNVAVSKNWTDKQGVKQTSTTWFSISKWSDRNMSQFLQYLKKGTQVLVVGEVSAKTYQNQQNQVVAQLQISADEIKLLGSNNNQNQQTSNPMNNNNSQQFNQFVEDTKGDNDDLPF